MACFEPCVSLALTQIEDIWNVYGSLTLNKGKPNWIFWKPLVCKDDSFSRSVNKRKMISTKHLSPEPNFSQIH